MMMKLCNKKIEISILLLLIQVTIFYVDGSPTANIRKSLNCIDCSRTSNDKNETPNEGPRPATNVNRESREKIVKVPQNLSAPNSKPNTPRIVESPKAIDSTAKAEDKKESVTVPATPQASTNGNAKPATPRQVPVRSSSDPAHKVRDNNGPAKPSSEQPKLDKTPANSKSKENVSEINKPSPSNDNSSKPTESSAQPTFNLGKNNNTKAKRVQEWLLEGSDDETPHIKIPIASMRRKNRPIPLNFQDYVRRSSPTPTPTENPSYFSNLPIYNYPDLATPPLERVIRPVRNDNKTVSPSNKVENSDSKMKLSTIVEKPESSSKSENKQNIGTNKTEKSKKQNDPSTSAAGAAQNSKSKQPQNEAEEENAIRESSSWDLVTDSELDTIPSGSTIFRSEGNPEEPPSNYILSSVAGAARTISNLVPSTGKSTTKASQAKQTKGAKR